MNERTTIVAAITADLDQVLQQLDILLGDEVNSTSTSSTGTPATAGNQNRPSENTVPAPRSPQGDTKAARKNSSSKAKPFDAKQLKRDFQGMSAVEAIMQVMVRSSERSFSADTLIQLLYEDIAESELRSARKSVAAVLFQGARVSRFEKVQDNPAQYKLGQAAAGSAGGTLG